MITLLLSCVLILAGDLEPLEAPVGVKTVTTSNSLEAQVGVKLEIPILQIDESSFFAIKPDANFDIVSKWNPATRKFDSPQIFFYPEYPGEYYLFASTGSNANVVTISVAGPVDPFTQLVKSWIPKDRSLAPQLGKIYLNVANDASLLTAQAIIDSVSAKTATLNADDWVDFSDNLAGELEKDPTPGGIKSVFKRVGEILLSVK